MTYMSSALHLFDVLVQHGLCNFNVTFTVDHEIVLNVILQWTIELS